MLADVEIYLLHQISMFCNQRSKLLAKFVFKRSTYRFNGQMGALLPDYHNNYMLSSSSCAATHMCKSDRQTVDVTV